MVAQAKFDFFIICKKANKINNYN